MTESQFTQRLLKQLRAKIHPPSGIVIKHSDRITAGIPDFSVTVAGHTTWFEVKAGLNTLTKLQETMLRALDGYVIRNVGRRQNYLLMCRFNDRAEYFKACGVSRSMILTELTTAIIGIVNRKASARQ